MAHDPAVVGDDADGRTDSVPHALDVLASGGLVVLVDDNHPSARGFLITPAELADWKAVSFVVRHTSGFLSVALPADRADALGLPAMVNGGDAAAGPAFAVAVDARHGITTGISARDRAHTARLLADSATTEADLARPGHVVPIRTHRQGLTERAQVPEATVDLCGLAGLAPAGILCEIVCDDGTQPSRAALTDFADTHRLPVITLRQLVAYRRHREATITAVAASTLPTRFGSFTAHAYRISDGAEHLALVMGELTPTNAPLVRVHSECLTGDVLSSLRCDCGSQLEGALRSIASAGAGVVVYLRGHEGRGIGLATKVAAYQLQDHGYDTVDANIALGKPVDARHYADAALILRDLGLRHVRLLTNNPDKCTSLTAAGIQVVERLPLQGTVTADNTSYLRAKSARLGHTITGLGTSLSNPA